MNPENPSSQPAETPAAPPRAPAALREGDHLVVRKRGAKLPPGCVVCNAPAAGRAWLTVRRFNYSFAVRLLLFLFIRGLLVVMFLLAPAARFEAGLCAEHLRRHQPVRWFKRCLILIVATGYTAPLLFVEQPAEYKVVAWALTTIFAFFIFALFILVRPGLLHGTYSKGAWLWVEGASPDFLQKLPDIAGDGQQPTGE